MIYFRDYAEKLRPGLNLYPWWKCPSVGFVLYLPLPFYWRFAWQFRYNYRIRKFRLGSTSMSGCFWKHDPAVEAAFNAP